MQNQMKLLSGVTVAVHVLPKESAKERRVGALLPSPRRRKLMNIIRYYVINMEMHILFLSGGYGLEPFMHNDHDNTAKNIKLL